MKGESNKYNLVVGGKQSQCGSNKMCVAKLWWYSYYWI